MEMTLLTISYIMVVCVMSQCTGQNLNATQDVDICYSQLRLRARVVRIKSPNFPEPVRSPRQCKCSVTGINNMDVFLKFLVSTQQSNDMPLMVNYTTGDKMRYWALGDRNYGNLKVSADNDIVIATNVSNVQVIFKSTGKQETATGFQIDIQAGKLDELSLNCSETTKINSDTTTPKSQDSGGILSAIEKLCSPYLVIILGSLCVALLLIVLVVSIILCCMVPKKKKRFMEVVRRSRFFNDNVKVKESGIYDEAFRKSQLDAGLQIYSDANTLQVPAPQDRNSGAHYMNSMKLTDNGGGTYGNV